MPRSASIPAGLLAFLSLALTLYLFISAELAQDRNILLGFLTGEGIFVTWLFWSFAQPSDTAEPEPIPLPRARQPEVMPGGPTLAPQSRPPYQHRPLQPTRPPARSSNALPPPPAAPRRSVALPPFPDLPAPLPGRSTARLPTQTPTTNMPRPTRSTIRLDDLLPQAPPSSPTPTIPSPPRPQAAPVNQGRPKRPRKYAKFTGDSADLPAKIALSEVQLCSDILSLGYACASSDGPVTTDEDDHLQGWFWCVIEKTSDKDAEVFLQALTAAANQAKHKGKQRLEYITTLTESIRVTREKKLIQASAELCGEIVASDGRLAPGEFATLSTALKGLGVRSIKAADIAEELLSNDDEIKEMKEELEIDDDTPKDERDRKLSIAWGRENSHTELKDAAKRELARHRMALIQKIRDIYRELDEYG